MDLEKLLLRIPERSEAEGDDDGEERFSRVLDLSSLPESWALALALVVELTLGSGCGRSASVGRGGNTETAGRARTTWSTVWERRTGWGETGGYEA